MLTDTIRFRRICRIKGISFKDRIYKGENGRLYFKTMYAAFHGNLENPS